MTSTKKSSKGKLLQSKKASPRVVVITGLSGSGKTVALRSLEDTGFFCVDNLPVSLIDSLITTISPNTAIHNIAIGIDIREIMFLHDIHKSINRLKSRHRIDILFLESDMDVLLRRFKETRRPHPLGGSLEEAIKHEKASLDILRQNADRIIDTSSFSPHQLRKIIPSVYFPRKTSKDMTVSLISFGFKYGIPLSIDLLFDVRFLPNPFFITSLRNLNGRNKAVARYVFKHPETKEFMTKIRGLLDFLIPLYIKEGKTYLSIAFGCTGGNHRSPAIVEEVAKKLATKKIDLNVIHRDMS